MNAPLIRSLSAEDLAVALEVASVIHFGICNELIAAGRGHETHSDICKKADPLSLRYIEVSDSYTAYSDERRARHQWDGTLNPIKRA